MIHYALRCVQDHAFDGWFNSSESFDKQAKLGLLECPECGSTKVSRGLMAPAVPKKGRARLPEPVEPPSPPAPAASAPEAAPAAPPAQAIAAPDAAGNPLAGGHVPDQVRAMLQRLRSEVEKNCDYVGPEFAEEARKIHRGESDKRGIYGETTPEQAESLAEEGIEVARIPWVPRADG